ncbi:histidine kinase [Clostridium sp. chh4-2]|uniref:MCP four helix bundle domain-containing protein n=1 Tax=Clostridium sp. chh4-2 TaxID=2067550 RepID=UPI000CCEE98F|nr:MCP four helix bundle domain-containing protein [Clostridium sp. chh4-2]PNV59534.1 histidine kinase [Clostridium sp. chh4-2]
MKHFRNARLKKKLILLGIVSVLGLVLMGASSLITTNQIRKSSTDMTQAWLPSVIIAEELNTATSDYRINEYNHVITHDEAVMEELEKEMALVCEDIEDKFRQYESLITNETDERLMREAEDVWHEYLEYSKEILEISRRNDTDDARELIIGQSRDYFNQVSSLFIDVVDFNKNGAEAASAYADTLYIRMIKIKMTTMGLISLLIIIMVVYIIKAVEKPVEELVEGTRRLASGDLSVSLNYESDDELGVLTESVNTLVHRLRAIIGDQKRVLRELGCENFDVKSECENAYSGDFAPILYSLEGLRSRLIHLKKQTQDIKRKNGK